MKVLVCLDRSDQSLRVLEKSIDIAKWLKAEMVLVTVVEDFIDFGEGIPPDFQEALLAEGQKALNGAMAKAQAAGLSARTILRSGPSPADAILTCAEEELPDLIVMGSRTKSGLDRFLIGSVASKVVSHAYCSVMVLRSGEIPPARKGAPTDPNLEGFPA